MARTVIPQPDLVTLSDDYDLATMGPADVKAKKFLMTEEEAREVVLEFNGERVELDLRDSNYEKLHTAMKPFLAAGRPVTPPKPEIPYNKDWSDAETYEMKAAHLLVKTWAVSADFATGAYNMPKDSRPAAIAGPCGLKVLEAWFAKFPDHPVNETLESWRKVRAAGAAKDALAIVSGGAQTAIA